MGEAPPGGAPSVQQYLVSGDRLFTTLLDVQKASMAPDRFLFSNLGCLQALPPCPEYVDEIRCRFKEAYTEVHVQTNLEADQQK